MHNDEALFGLVRWGCRRRRWQCKLKMQVLLLMKVAFAHVEEAVEDFYNVVRVAVAEDGEPVAATIGASLGSDLVWI